MILCPIIDGSDFWASEIAENSRNKGSKKSHNGWSTKVKGRFLCGSDFIPFDFDFFAFMFVFDR